MWGDLSDLRDVLVQNNVVGPSSGYLFYNGVIGSGYNATNVRFDNNVLLRRPKGNEYGVWFSTTTNPMLGTHTGNLYADGTSADND